MNSRRDGCAVATAAGTTAARQKGVSAGADLRARTDGGKSSIDFAIEANLADVVDVLETATASGGDAKRRKGRSGCAENCHAMIALVYSGTPRPYQSNECLEFQRLMRTE